MGILDSGSSDFLKRTNFYSGSEPDVAGPETGFKENFTASAENFAFHFKSTSEAEAMDDLMNHQLDLIYAHQNPDFRFNPKHKDGLNIKRNLTLKEKGVMAATGIALPLLAASMRDFEIKDFGYEGKKKRFQDLTKTILDIQAEDPNTKIKTWDQIMMDAQNESQRLKEVLNTVSNTRTWGGVAGMFTGVMKEALTDPFVIASMGLGWTKITGGTKSMNAAKAFMTEFLIGAGSETLIQPFVMDWQAKLETPWKLKDAVVTILTVGGFAGITRASGSYVVDLVEAGKAAKTLRAQGETVKADTLESYIDLFNGAPTARDVVSQDAQLKAIDDIQRAFDEEKTGPELEEIIARVKDDLDPEQSAVPLTKENFNEYLDNRDFNYTSVNKEGGFEVDQFLYVKTKLARNPIELQLKEFIDNPELVERAWKELGVVWSREAADWVKAPANIKKYFDDLVKDKTTKLKPATAAFKEKLRQKLQFEKPVKLQNLSRSEIISTNAAFREPQTKLNLNVDEYHKRAIPLQAELESIGRTIQEELKEAVGFITPGIKLLENVSTKIGRKGYGNTGGLTDVIRIGFLTKEYNNTDSIVKALSQKVEILEEGLVTTPAGYRDHKLLVRFKNGLIGEVQIWEPHVLAAKEGKAFVKKNFPKYMQKYIEDMDIPTRKNSGHTIYDQQKALMVNGKIPAKNKKAFKDLIKRQNELYNYAKRFSNDSWNSRLDIDAPDSKISTGEAGSQAPGSAAAGTKKPDIDPSEGSTTTAGRPSQSTKSDTSSKLNIEDIIPGATDRIVLNDPELKRIMDEEIMEAQRIIDEAGGEMDVPFTVIDDLGNEVTLVQGVKKVFNDIENDEKALASLNKCMGRAA